MMAKRLTFCVVCLALMVTGCARGGGVSRSQCDFQQDCNHHITYWQNAIDAVVQANFPTKNLTLLFITKILKTLGLPLGEI